MYLIIHQMPGFLITASSQRKQIGSVKEGGGGNKVIGPMLVTDHKRIFGGAFSHAK